MVISAKTTEVLFVFQFINFRPKSAPNLAQNEKKLPKIKFGAKFQPDLYPLDQFLLKKGTFCANISPRKCPKQDFKKILCPCRRSFFRWQIKNYPPPFPSISQKEKEKKWKNINSQYPKSLPLKICLIRKRKKSGR